MERELTISDIAKEVGVSKTTISRYLNGKFEYMSVETKERIQEVIQKNHYVPNNVARTLKSKKSNLIGVIVNSLRYQIGAQVVTGINNVCIQNGYGIVVCCSDDDPEKEAQSIQHCLNQQVDGIVIIPCQENEERYLELCQQGIPVVLCTRRLMNWPYGCVYVRHDELITKMMLHLKEQGFEKVQFLLDVNNFHKVKMAEGFAHLANKLFGMPKDQSVAVVGGETVSVSSALDAFMRQYPTERKAMFAVNTHTLFLLLKATEQRSLRIPEEMGVCGYDAIGWSELVYPGVTSIRQPMDRMGVTAGEKIIRCIQEGSQGGGHTALDGIVAFRSSTARK